MNGLSNFGWQSTHDEQRLGQLSTSCDDAHVGQVRKIVVLIIV
jgi:hypothetical protein